jgi:hypothetical protein
MPFSFTGRLKKFVVVLESEQLTEEERKHLLEEDAQASLAIPLMRASGTPLFGSCRPPRALNGRRFSGQLVRHRPGTKEILNSGERMTQPVGREFEKTVTINAAFGPNPGI